MYTWITNTLRSTQHALSGYLSNHPDNLYIINSPNQSKNINLIDGFPTDFSKIADRTIAVYKNPSFNLLRPIQLGISGYSYNLNVVFDIFTKTDKDLEFIVSDVLEMLNDTREYYDWGLVISSGLGAGLTDYKIDYETIFARRLRDDKYSTNIYMNHKGSVFANSVILTDNQLI